MSRPADRSRRFRRPPSSPAPQLSARSAALQAFSRFAQTREALPDPPRELSDRDRRLYTQLLQGLLRHDRWLTQLIRNRLRTGRLPDPEVEAVLKLGALELLLLERLPDHATLNEAVQLVRDGGRARATGLVNGVLRTLQRDRDAGRLSPQEGSLAVRTSHPDWMVHRWEQTYGKAATEAICEANNTFEGITLVPAPGWTGARLQDALGAEGVALEPHPAHPELWRAPRSSGLWETETYRAGGFWVQDASSFLFTQTAGPLLQGRGLDVCAAPGGKTLGLFPGRPEGSLVAADRSLERLKALRRNFRRLNHPLPELLVADGTQLPFADASFDWLLLDAPCSATGTIRKNPDLKWRRTADSLLDQCPLQRQLLSEAARLVRPEGMIAYATCSLEPEENALQVQAFLEAHPDFVPVAFPQTDTSARWVTPEGALQVVTDPDHMGFFSQLLQKKSS